MVYLGRAACLALMIFAGVATAVSAEGPKPFPDFSAKRVKPPTAGQAKRITVQITPDAPDVATAPTAGIGGGVAPSGPRAQPLEWFWADVSPDVSASGPGRLEPALMRLSNPPEGQRLATPRLATLQGIAQTYGVDILLSSIGTQVSPALALAVIAVESAGDAEAESTAGAQGLMQLMPATAARFDVSDAFDGADNIGGGIRYLDFLMEKFAGDPILVLAGYNAGENAIATHEGVPPFAETRAYVPKVLAAFEVARALCVTPPELISDGCVFANP
ncbi:lytic transglycosylase domain-containing protein [Shimia sp. MMG029]|uniref:lytic transglycosylase domain-containing protein n=1 Tax=Shimia sp. MMG029 TaxID=3021978 RepID=UPI003F8FC6A3